MGAGLMLVIGGARAGKSDFAQNQAALAANVSFIATAQALDDEMHRRIAEHKAQRPLGWETLEEPLHIAQALRQAKHAVVVLDCLTLWVSNLMHAKQAVLPQLEGFLEAYSASDKALWLVSNEVGLGIVPENALARQYRDLLGQVNRRVAEAADRVYWMVAGIPVQIKGRV